MGVSDALELLSSSIAGGHTEEIATGNSEDCVLEIDRGSSSLVGFGEGVVLHLCVICWCTQSRQGDSINSDDRKIWGRFKMGWMSMLDCEQHKKLLKMQAELENGRQLGKNMEAEWDALEREEDRLFEIVKLRFRQRKVEQDYLLQKEQLRLVAQGKMTEDDLIRWERSVEGNRDEGVSEVKAVQRDLSEMKTVNEKLTVENQELRARIAKACEKLSAREQEAKSRENKLQLRLDRAWRLNNSLTAQMDGRKTEMGEQQERIKAIQEEKASVSERFQQLQIDHEAELKERDKTLCELNELVNMTGQETISLNEKVRILEDDKWLLQEKLENAQEMADKVKNENECMVTVLLKNSERVKELTQMVSVVQAHNSHLMTQLTENKEEKGKTRLVSCASGEDQVQHELEHKKELFQSQMNEKEGESGKIIEQQRSLHREKLVELQDQPCQQKQHLQQTAQELEQLCKDAQQSSLMDMELADYERLVKELNIQISEKDNQIEDLKKQLLTQKNKVLEGEAQYLFENGLTKLVHSGFTPHREEVHVAWTNALSHAPDVGISCVVLLLACLTILSPLRSLI